MGQPLLLCEQRFLNNSSEIGDENRREDAVRHGEYT